MCDVKRKPYRVNEPAPIQFFADPNCTGADGDLAQNRSANLHEITAMNRTSATSIIIPPNISGVQVWDRDISGGGGYWSATIDRTIPRLNEVQIASNCVNCGPTTSGTFDWNDRIYGAKANIGKSWSEFARDCCTKAESAENCKEIYGPNSSTDCYTSLVARCSSSPNMAFDDPVCREWYSGNGRISEQDVKQIACNSENSLSDRRCKDWCRANPGKCDTAAQPYCQKNPTQSFCACLTSPIKKYNPKCIDSTCIGGVDASGIGGYVSASQSSAPCPNIVDCQSQIDLASAGRLTAGNVQVVQNCGNASEPAPPVPGATSGTTDKILGLDKTLFYLILFILVVVLIGGSVAAYLLLKKPKKIKSVN